MYELIVAGLGYYHDRTNGTLYGSTLKLLRDFSNASCGFHEAARGYPIVLRSNLFKNTVDVDSVIKALVEKAR